MKRGVMQLLHNEIIEALNCLPDTSLDTPLYFKLNSASCLNKSRVAIQFDTDELELLQDSLGIPLIEDYPVKKSLRKKIQTFIFFLRNESLTVE